MAFSRREAMVGALTAPLLGAQAAAQTKLKPTGQETLGPFYPVRAPTSHDTDLTHFPGRKGGRARGQVIQITGRVFDTSGRPLPKAALTVWQANAAGRYTNPVDRKGMNGGQTSVASGDAILPLRFEVVQKGKNISNPQVLELEIHHATRVTCGQKAQ